MDFGRILLLVGLLIFIIGVIFTLHPISFPHKLPGDILIKKGNFIFYFPIVTSILLSIIISLIFRYFFKR